MGATRKELEKRVATLEKDMMTMNEMVSRLMMQSLLTEMVAEIRMWIHQQGIDELAPLAIEWMHQPLSMEKAIQKIMLEANAHFKNREAGVLVWEELRGYMKGKLFRMLEKKPQGADPTAD